MHKILLREDKRRINICTSNLPLAEPNETTAKYTQMLSEDLPLGTGLEEEEKMQPKAMQETSTPKDGGPIRTHPCPEGSHPEIRDSLSDPSVNLYPHQLGGLQQLN